MGEFIGNIIKLSFEIGILLAWINNIIHLFDYWHSLSWFFKAFYLAGIPFFPLGIATGAWHYFF